MALTFDKLNSVFKSVIKKDLTKGSSRSVVGVDIGSSAIKVVQIHDHNGVPTLDTYGELQLGPYGSVEIGRTTNLQAAKLTEAFADILREASVTSKNVALAISYNASFATIVSIPTKDQTKISGLIPIEARKYVPVPLNEVSLDWFPVSSLVDLQQNTTRVLLAAIHNDALKKYQTMIMGASMKPQFNEIEIFSSIRSCATQEDDVVAIVDLGASSTKLYIAKRGMVGKTHSVRTSGLGLTTELAATLGIEFNEAEELKRRVGLRGLEDDPRIQKVFSTSLERGFREIHKVIERYGEEEQVKVTKVILSGSTALLNGIDVYAQDMLSRPVEIADPFSKVAYPAFLEDTLKEAGPSFAVAVGAALRGLMTE